MNYLLLSRLLFFTACGLIAGWHVRRALLTSKWPTLGFNVTRHETPVAFWMCMGMGIALMLAAIVLIASLLMQELLG